MTQLQLQEVAVDCTFPQILVAHELEAVLQQTNRSLQASQVRALANTVGSDGLLLWGICHGRMPRSNLELSVLITPSDISADMLLQLPALRRMIESLREWHSIHSTQNGEARVPVDRLSMTYYRSGITPLHATATKSGERACD